MSLISSIGTNLQLLRQTFNLHLGVPQSEIKDSLIISLHLTGDPRQPEAGISIFDTRGLTSATIPSTQHQSLLVTREFYIGSGKHSDRKSWKFCFGTPSKRITFDGLRQEFQEIVLDRNVILVRPGESAFDSGIKLLKTAKIDLHPIYVVDIQKVAEAVFPSVSRWSIERLLKLLDCPFDPGMLFDAGNRANLTLRSLFLLAAVDAKNSPSSVQDQALVSVLKRIGRDFVPLEEYCQRQKIQEEARFSRAQNRIQRRDVRLKEAEERARKWLPANVPDFEAQREAEENMDKSFDEMTARTLAGWWKTKSGSWKMLNAEDA